MYMYDVLTSIRQVDRIVNEMFSKNGETWRGIVLERFNFNSSRYVYRATRVPHIRDRVFRFKYV